MPLASDITSILLYWRNWGQSRHSRETKRQNGAYRFAYVYVLAWKNRISGNSFFFFFFFSPSITSKCLSDSVRLAYRAAKNKLGASTRGVIYSLYPLHVSLTLRCTMSHIIIMLGILPYHHFVLRMCDIFAVEWLPIDLFPRAVAG